jgi:hypothetical protein
MTKDAQAQFAGMNHLDWPVNLTAIAASVGEQHQVFRRNNGRMP